MDKSAAKSFALNARKELTNLVIVQATNLGITSEGIEKSKPLEDGIIVNGQVFGPETAKAYEHLIRRIEISGYHETMKEAIYTWFNRFVALRFMEVHDYLPIQMRLLSSQTVGKKEPDAVTQAGQLIDELALDRELVYRLQDEHHTEHLFKYLVEKQSRQLEKNIPQVFEEVEQDLYLLLPDGLLRDNGFIDQLVNDISESDWQEIEIIGWLYQYYISEEKDTIFANISKNKIGKDEIGAATQIFTPKWIVQYLVGNSLGRLWLEDYPHSNLREHLPYYVEDAEQPVDVIKQLESLKGKPINPEEIKIMDPSMGSGHMLLEAFDVMRAIYLEQGYRPREIPSLILSKNLYGLDIDKRASQLASFALVMKAREYDRRFFDRNIKLNLLGFEESNGLPIFENIELKNLEEANEELQKLYNNFHDAKLYGSIIKLTPVNIEMVKQAVENIKSLAINDLFARGYLDYEVPYIEHLIHLYKLLSEKYHVTVTNPPYMGSGGMSALLGDYLKKEYPLSKSDLFAVMMERMYKFTLNDGFISNVTMQSWMFLSSLEKLRKKILYEMTIINMVHMGNMVMRIAFGTAATIFRKRKTNDYIGKYQKIEYSDLKDDYPIIFPNRLKTYQIHSQSKFFEISGAPIAYWISNNQIDLYQNKKIIEYGKACKGIDTGNNNIFLRLWYEINDKKRLRPQNSILSEDSFSKKWFPYNKGGEVRKWYGNNYYVINWEDKGKKIKDFQKSNLRNQNQYFMKGLTWSTVSSKNISSRFFNYGYLFDNGGTSLFSEDYLKYIGGLLNSIVGEKLLSLSPTLNFQPGDINKLPLIIRNKGKVESIVEKCILCSKENWDSFETSWDFETHPFLSNKTDTGLIENTFKIWEQATEENFNELKANEEELNRIFIDIYGLQDELTPEVEDKDVTIRKADLERDVKSFLSYLVGVIFGRYSLDELGLIYAGGDFDPERYQSYQPDDNNIIPLTHENYFSDDIVTHITDLVTLIYGEETLEDNLLFIAQALKMKGSETSRDTIRRYFIKEFFKDHKKIYQNRPIYWQMSSGKQEAFKAIFYLHRYDHAALARVRTEYVLPLTNTVTELSNQMQTIIDGSALTREVASARKEFENYQKQLQELRDYDLILKNLADQHIELDLDDGVKVNYEKFQNVSVTNTQTGKPGKMNLLEKL